MDEEKTCGRGLAERAVLPARLGDLLAAMTEVLARHVKALDAADESARGEKDAYVELADRLGAIATDLRETAARMEGSRELPMGRHDPRAMADPAAAHAFARFVQLERDTIAVLQRLLNEDQAMLGAMPRG